MESEWLTTGQAAQYLGVSIATIRRWAKAGQIPHYRIGTTRRFKTQELEVWLSERKNNA